MSDENKTAAPDLAEARRLAELYDVSGEGYLGYVFKLRYEVAAMLRTLAAEVERLRHRNAIVLAAEHAMSGAYVRLREILGAMDPPTPCDPPALFAYVEEVARDRLRAAPVAVPEEPSARAGLHDDGKRMLAKTTIPAPEGALPAPAQPEGVRDIELDVLHFLDAAAGEGLFLNGLDAADLHESLKRALAHAKRAEPAAPPQSPAEGDSLDYLSRLSEKSWDAIEWALNRGLNGGGLVDKLALVTLQDLVKRDRGLAAQALTLDGMTVPQFIGAELFEFQEATGCDTAAEFKAKQANVQPKGTPAGYVTAIEEGKVLMLPRSSLDTASLVPLYAATQASAPAPTDLKRDLEMAASLMDEAANLLEAAGPGVLEKLPNYRWPLCDELGGAAGILRDRLVSPAPAVPDGEAQRLITQIREVCAATLKAGPGVAVPIPDDVRAEFQRFMRGEPNLIEKLPFCDVQALAESPEVVTLANSNVPVQPTGGE